MNEEIVPPEHLGIFVEGMDIHPDQCGDEDCWCYGDPTPGFDTPTYRFSSVGAHLIYWCSFKNDTDQCLILADSGSLPPFGVALDEFIKQVQESGGTVYKAVAER